jgi:hypothetical protein
MASGWQNASNKTDFVKKILDANLRICIFISLLYKKLVIQARSACVGVLSVSV